MAHECPLSREELNGLLAALEPGADAAVASQVTPLLQRWGFHGLERALRNLRAVREACPSDEFDALLVTLVAALSASADPDMALNNLDRAVSTCPDPPALAQVERKRISRRTREGLAAAKAAGVKLGRPALNVALEAGAAELRRQGLTLQDIADTFNAQGLRTAKGTEYKPTTVYRMIERFDPEANQAGGGWSGKGLAAVA